MHHQAPVHPWNMEVWRREGLSRWHWWRELPKHHHQVPPARPHMWQFHSLCSAWHSLWRIHALQGRQWWGRTLWLVPLQPLCCCLVGRHCSILALVSGWLDVFIEWKWAWLMGDWLPFQESMTVMWWSVRRTVPKVQVGLCAPVQLARLCCLMEGCAHTFTPVTSGAPAPRNVCLPDTCISVLVLKGIW